MKQHRILFLAANPDGLTERKLDEEARQIHEELRRGNARDRFEFVPRLAVRPMDLLRALREVKPSIVHFSGPASVDGIYLADEHGRPARVTRDALRRTLGAAGQSVQIVVLNGCAEEDLGKALCDFVPVCAGTSISTGDAAARAFSIGFYGGLASSESVARACLQGGAAMHLEVTGDHAQPILHRRGDVDPETLVLADGGSGDPLVRARTNSPPPPAVRSASASSDLPARADAAGPGQEASHALYRLFERMLQRLERRQPMVMAFGALGCSFLLILGAFALGLAEVPSRSDPFKDVGYINALNWSVVFSVCVPLVVGCTIAALRSIDPLLKELAANRMLARHVLDPHPGIVTADLEEFRQAWRIDRRLLVKWWCWASLLLAMLPTVAEWAAMALYPLVSGDCPSAAGFDWTIARCEEPWPARAANLAFSTATAVCQVIYVSLLWLLLAFIVALIRLFYSNFPETRLFIRPRPVGNDQRRGFQLFQVVLTRILLACLGAYISFYLARLWKVFLRTDSQTLAEELVAGLPGSLLDVKGGEFTSTAVIMGATLFLVLCIAGPFFVLRATAKRGRDLLEQLDPPAATALGTMQIWPISYLPQNRLLVLASLGLISVLFYRFGLLFSLAALLVIVAHFVRLASSAAARPARSP
jgi:hypothetical protein